VIGMSISSGARRRRSGDLTVPEVSAMLDFSRWTDTGTLSIPDVRASTQNPATQATSGRKPTVSTSNGRTVLTFATASAQQLVWPVAANNNATQKWAFACWYKATTYPPYKCLLSFGGATGAYNNTKAELYFNNNRSAELYFFGQDTTGYNGRKGLTPGNALPAAGTWTALFAAFDGTQATEAARHRFYVDWSLQALTFSNIGTGGTPVLLRPDAANVPIVLGNYMDANDTTYSIDGAVASKIWIFNGIPNLADAAAMLNQVHP
jgi:hypothetical protein